MFAGHVNKPEGVSPSLGGFSSADSCPPLPHSPGQQVSCCVQLIPCFVTRKVTSSVCL